MNNQAFPNLAAQDVVQEADPLADYRNQINKGTTTSGYIAPTNPYPTNPGTCPSCGHCPTCGRHNWPGAVWGNAVIPTVGGNTFVSFSTS